MRNLNYELKQLCRRNRDGSFATQRDRERVLDLVANQLHDLGYRHLAATSLKPKHVEGLVERWQSEGLAVGTIKNRMAELRWWAEKIGKQNVIARDNDHYGIGNRQYVTNVSKARQLTGGELARITDPYTAMSLRLRADKVAALSADNPDLIVTANIGCQLHLAAAATVPVKHWIQLLDEAGSDGVTAAPGAAAG